MEVKRYLTIISKDVLKLTLRPFCDGCDIAMPDTEFISGNR